MGNLVRIFLIVEDIAHEKIFRALIRRIARDERIKYTITTSIKAGGSGKVTIEIKGFQKVLKRGLLPGGIPDLLIVMRDSNCEGFHKIKRELEEIIDKDLFPLYVIGCPDPHAEKWFFADQESFYKLFGFIPGISLSECRQDYYKNALKDAIKKAGWPSTQGGIEYAEDVFSLMDFSNIAKNDDSLITFINDIRASFKQMKVRNT